MNILLACQRSGYLRELLRSAGHNAYTCDLEQAEDGPHVAHYIGDVLNVLHHSEGYWDCMIAMPECRDLCGSGLHWNNRGRRGMTPEQSWECTEKAYQFATALKDAPIPHILIENSVGILSTRWGKPQQIVQPWWFGDDASKATCFWLKNFPPVKFTLDTVCPPRLVMHEGKLRARWANQTDSGQNRLGPSPTRSADRARTYPGIARALFTAVEKING